ncbi:MAG: glycine--tRNA ligase [Patescibacteria group bacterium]
MDKVVSLAKRRGFVFPGSEIYGGLANSWDYGPLGVELKNNIKKFWWKRFVEERDDMVGIDSAIIMNPKVWEASGHLKEFSDPLVECKKCHERFRADALEEKKCPNCGASEFTVPRSFNLLFKTYIGAAEDTKSTVYLRGENAQGMFVNFKNVLDTSRRQLPFGIAQIGKAFRNEITPGNFIFRTREFEIMELEYFVKKDEWKEHFAHWQKEMTRWIKDVGIDEKKVYEVDVPDGERAHYSDKTVDFEFEYPFGQKELYGLAYRTDFDLKNHEKESGENLKYRDPETGEEFHPHVIEPSMGAERTFLAILLSAYEETDARIVLHLKPRLAPYKAAVFPLLANKPELVKLARKTYDLLRKDFSVAWDDRGNIGKRYYSQDEIGTPYCITIDFDSLEKHDATIRDRDTMKQERVMIEKLADYLSERIA